MDFMRGWSSANSSKTSKTFQNEDDLMSNVYDAELQGKVTDRYLVGMLGRFLAPYRRAWILVFALLLAVTLLSLVPPYLIQRAVDGPFRNGDLSGLIPYGML